MHRLLLLALLCAFSSCASRELEPAAWPGELRVLTFNLRYGTADDGEHRWGRRLDLAREVIEDHAPHVLAVQEALDFQVDWLRRVLPHHRVLGSHRGGGRKDEFCGLLLDTRTTRVLEHGQFWLSDEPTRPGSVGWDAACTRMCVWARLQHGDVEFLAYATHLDHRGRWARLESANMIRRHLDGQLARRRVPVVVCGDFNAGEDSECLVALRGADLTDSFRELHPHESPVGTFHGFRGGSDGPKIDACLVSDEWEVIAAEIDRRERDGLHPSDHNPVSCTLSLPARRGVSSGE